MTLREIIIKNNFRVREEKIPALGRKVYYAWYNRHKGTIPVTKVQEGVFMVVNYPQEFTQGLSNFIRYFLRKHQNYRAPRPRFKKIRNNI